MLKLPDISKWNVSNVTNMSHMFFSCSKLSSLPNGIIYWDTSKVQNMDSMFCGCESLVNIPDIITEWKISNVKKINNMFKYCKKLSSFPCASKDSLFKSIKLKAIFEGCNELLFSGILKNN